jgi:hypothetical protein
VLSGTEVPRPEAAAGRAREFITVSERAARPLRDRSRGRALRPRGPSGEESELELRQVFEAEDFGPELTPEQREREDRLRGQLVGQQR